LNEFKCDGNWKLQLYRYSDCSTAWVYVEYCGAGCCNGKCLPELTTTTTTLPAEEKAAITGLIVLSDQAKAALLLLVLFLVVLMIIWLWKSEEFKKRNKPEWFGEDC
jgi:hypothetical protein